MAKLGISLPDELCSKLDAAAKDEGRTVSGVIAEALIAYFSQNGKTTSTSPVPSGTSHQPPIPASSTASSVDLQHVLSQIRDLTAEVNDNTTTTSEILKTIGDLDERLCKLWHQVNDK